MQLIIDDGVKNRGHRKNIYNSNFTQVGIAARGKFPNYKTIAVHDYLY